VAQRQVGGLLHGVIHNPQLGAELRARTGFVHGPEHTLPESSADGQQRVVLQQQAAVA
jgi:hypothetical protein